VWLDSFDPEDRDAHPELGLHATDVWMHVGHLSAQLAAVERGTATRGTCLYVGYQLDDWLVPWATAAEFRRFIAAWARNDPNGTWCPNGITEADGALIYECGELGRDVWCVAGVDDAGTPCYALRGWTWVP
jgi:hypothetical protein